MPRIRRPCHPTLLPVLSGLLTVGCGSGWQAVRSPWPESLPARQQVQVYAGGEAVQLHAVRIAGDSISGVPYLQPVGCDSCRVGFARPAVDSLRVGDPPQGLFATVMLGSVGFLIVGFLAGWIGPTGT